MKIFLCLLLMICLPCLAAAEQPWITEELPDAPLWTAEMYRLTRIRRVKDMDSQDWLGRVPEGAVVDVYCWSEDWCVCGYNGDIGYVPTERLTAFRRLGEALLPGSIPVEGIAVMTEDVLFQADESWYGAKAGTMVCIQSGGVVPVWRAISVLSEESYRFEPFVPAAEAQPGDALYGFTTFYNDALGGKYPENRVFNIEEAVRRLQGVIIQPGETFSFNALCGPYKKSNGYRMAKNVSRDGYGYGGGVCQVCTTIFNAVQGVAHRLEAWQLHSYAGVKYVPRNLDAAVSSTRDFAFVNLEAFPLAMESCAQDGVLTVIFRRAEEAALSAEEDAE